MPRRSPVVWQLQAWLEIPWSASLKTKVALQVAEPPAGLHPGDLHEPPGFVRHYSTNDAPPAPVPAPAPARKLPKFCDQCGTARPPDRTNCAGCGRHW